MPLLRRNIFIRAASVNRVDSFRRPLGNLGETSGQTERSHSDARNLRFKHQRNILVVSKPQSRRVYPSLGLWFARNLGYFSPPSSASVHPNEHSSLGTPRVGHPSYKNTAPLYGSEGLAGAGVAGTADGDCEGRPGTGTGLGTLFCAGGFGGAGC